jgi:hypothetical protein
MKKIKVYYLIIAIFIGNTLTAQVDINADGSSTDGSGHGL